MGYFNLAVSLYMPVGYSSGLVPLPNLDDDEDDDEDDDDDDDDDSEEEEEEDEEEDDDDSRYASDDEEVALVKAANALEATRIALEETIRSRIATATVWPKEGGGNESGGRGRGVGELTQMSKGQDTGAKVGSKAGSGGCVVTHFTRRDQIGGQGQGQGQGRGGIAIVSEREGTDSEVTGAATPMTSSLSSSPGEIFISSTLSTHHFNTPCQHTLSIHLINTPYQHIR